MEKVRLKAIIELFLSPPSISLPVFSYICRMTIDLSVTSVHDLIPVIQEILSITNTGHTVHCRYRIYCPPQIQDILYTVSGYCPSTLSDRLLKRSVLFCIAPSHTFTERREQEIQGEERDEEERREAGARQRNISHLLFPNW